MNDELRGELREIAWKYFDRHAEQRLKTFHFYIVLATAISAGILAFAREPNQLTNGWPLALLLAIFSFVFWKLDCRNRGLVNHSEMALKELERALDLPDEEVNVPHRCKLFLREEYISNQAKRFPDAPLWTAHFSYSTCFRTVFGIFGFGGLFLAVVLLFSALT